jgi:oxygen-independent coproporphyrinogen-3 oxidase
MIDRPLALYLHIPFCRHRCSYCDFNTYTSLDSLKAAYTAALCQEIEIVGQLAGEKRPCHTIFFGGGTPSLMPPAMLGQILQTIRRHFAMADDAEITMEANPGTVDLAYLTAVYQLGINRISLGVQTAVASELALLEREHDFADAVAAVAAAREAGFSNFSLDLIYGVPGQTLASWEKSVRAVLAQEPPHLSLYCLTIEPGTPLNRWLGNGRIQPPDPDLAADQYELACQILAEQGYIHYEISNWARPELECRHNLVYWRNQEYLGLGAGAHGSANGWRYENVKQPRVYIRRLAGEAAGPFPLSPAAAAQHTVDQAEAMSDTIITQLRLLQEGLDLAAFETRFGQSLDDAFDGIMSQLVDWGLLVVGDGRVRLTQKGRFLSNQVFYRFM